MLGIEKRMEYPSPLPREEESSSLIASLVYLCSYNHKIINSSLFPLDFVQQILIEHRWAHRGAHF